MTTLPARAALVVLLLVAACSAEPPPTAPTQSVQGRVRARHLARTGAVELADTAALGSLTVDGFVGDAYWAFSVTKLQDGFVATDVPEDTLLYLKFAGPDPTQPVTLRLAARYVVVPAREAPIDLGVRGVLGRPGAPTCRASVWGSLQLAGDGIQAGRGFQLVSPDVGMVMGFEPTSTWPQEDPHEPLYGRWLFPGDDRRCVVSEDWTYLFESVEPRSDTVRLWSVSRVAGPVSLSFGEFETVPQVLQTTLTTPPAGQVVVDRDAFLAPLPPSERGMDGAVLDATVHAVHAAEGVIGPVLLERRAWLEGEASRQGLSYVRPLPAPWEELVGMRVAGPFGEVGRRMLRARLETEPLVATLSPPEQLEGGAFGVDARVARFTWQPPRLGSAAWYGISFTHELGPDGQLERAHFLTRDTTLRVPPGLLPSGRYIVTVTAYAPERAPDGVGARSLALWPELAWATTPPYRLFMP